MKSRLDLPDSVARQLESWAADGYPLEVCGLLIGHSDGQHPEAERATRARNLNKSRPRDRYDLAPEDFLAAEREARADGLEVIGIWHSHPDHPARPSQTDLEAAWEGYSYLIIATTKSGVTDLRSWRLHGDCFLEETVDRKEASL